MPLTGNKLKIVSMEVIIDVGAKSGPSRSLRKPGGGTFAINSRSRMAQCVSPGARRGGKLLEESLVPRES